MTKDPKIEQILDRILDGTKRGNVQWIEEKTILTSDTNRKFTHKSKDNLTSFNIEIRLDSNFKLYGPLGGYYLYIYNQNFPSRFIQVASSNYPKVELVYQEIYQTLVVPTLPNKSQSKTLDDILDSFEEIPEKRDRMIDEILEAASEKTSEPKNDTNDKTPTEERKGFFKKLLGL